MRALLPFRLVTLSLVLLLPACAGRGTTSTALNPIDQAAAEATALVQSAQATALILQAQAQATALIAEAGTPQASSAVTAALPAATSVLPVLTVPPPAVASDTPLTPTVTHSTSMTVTVTGVSLAAEGGFVIVNFLAPPEVATTWYQGAVWVEDEATGQLYSEIGVLPTVGPLFGRPVEPGQPGYVMLVNAPRPLGVGAVVTVVLGDYRFEHVPIE